MNVQNLREPGFAVDSPAVISDGHQNTWVIAATQGDGPGFDSGHVLARSLSGAGEWVRVTDAPGAYAGAQAACDRSGVIRVVFTEYQDGVKRVLLASMQDGRALGTVDVSGGFGKHDCPDIAVQGGRLWIAWHSYDSGGSELQMRSFRLIGNFSVPEPESGICVTASRDAKGSRVYQPVLSVDDDGCLYLFHESFHDGRYHLLAQAIPSESNELSDAIEIGFGEGNDQGASACAHEGGVAIAWENSSPLYEGYVYPPFPEVTIPAFGHGWRIDTRMGLRRVSYRNGEWLVDDIGTTPRVMVDAPDSSGCPRVLTDDQGRLLLAYLSYTSYPEWWKIVVAAYNGGAWETVGELGGLSMVRRIPVGVAWDAESQRLVLGALYHTHQDMGMAVEGLELHASAAVSPFTHAGDVVRPSSSRIEPERTELEYGGERLTAWWGDLHMHSNISPCSLHTGFHCTEIEDKYRFSRDVGTLDFALVADHDHMSDFDWMRTKRAGAFNNLRQEFLSFTGFEWTSSMMSDHENFGHRNVLFMGDEARLLRCRHPESDTPTKLWKSLDGYRCMTIPHHTSCADHTFEWDYHNPEFEPLVEIFQVRGSAEYDGCPMYPTNYGRRSRPGCSVVDALNRGYRLGFTSGGEHEGVGVTAVYAPELTRESIFDALMARHTYGTTGARIVLDFRVDGHLMGEEIEFRETPTISVKTRGTSPIESVRFMRDGELLQEWKNPGTQVEIEWIDRPLPLGPHYYYAVISQSDGEMAWSSPVFLLTPIRFK